MNRAVSSAIVAIALSCAARAADRAEITFADGKVFPESVTSTKNGAIFFGSLGLDSVYRAAPNASKAEVWIQPKTQGLQTVLGVFADEAAGTLWVCASASGDKAEVKVLKDGLTGPTAVTLVGGVAFVSEARLNYRNDPKLRDTDPGPFRAVAVRYQAPR